MRRPILKTGVEKLEEQNTILLTVEVPEDMFDEAMEQAYREISSKLNYISDGFINELSNLINHIFAMLTKLIDKTN